VNDQEPLAVKVFYPKYSEFAEYEGQILNELNSAGVQNIPKVIKSGVTQSGSAFMCLSPVGKPDFMNGVQMKTDFFIELVNIIGLHN